MAPKTEHLEREVKLTAGVDFKLPDLRKVVGGGTIIRLPEQALHTSYFDTADFRLWDRGLTLRHRSAEDGESGLWTLKLPEEGDGRTIDRTELSWAGGRERIPEAATGVLRGVIRRAGLKEVVALESTRQRLVLHASGGRSLGEIDDDIVTVKSGARQGLTFRQIEFEIGLDASAPDADPDMVDAVLHEICRAGAHTDGEQKFTKSLGLGGGEASRSKAQEASSPVSVADLVRLSMVDGLDRLLDYDFRLRIDPSNPPVRAVHQARVAARRLRADLKTFAPLLDPVWQRHTITELKWLGQVLGRIRDADVLADRLAAAMTVPVEAQGADELHSRLAAQRRAHSAELDDVLNGERYLQLLERLHAAACAPPFYPNQPASPESERGSQDVSLASDTAALLVRRHWKALRRKVRKVGHHPNDEDLHQIRFRSKRLRYAAERATLVAGKPARRTAHRAEELQTILGKHHDAVAAEAWLRQIALLSTPPASFVAGRLVAEEERKQREYASQWRSVWRELRIKRNTSWLR